MLGPFLTALYGLNEIAAYQPGERVLVHVDSGGVGLAAIQVARQAGAEILAISGSAEDRDHLAVDRHPACDGLAVPDLRRQVMEITGGQGVDVVINRLSGEAREKTLGLLAPFGRFIEVPDCTAERAGNTALRSGRPQSDDRFSRHRRAAGETSRRGQVAACRSSEGIKSGEFPASADGRLSGVRTCRRMPAHRSRGPPRSDRGIAHRRGSDGTARCSGPSAVQPEATYVLTGGFGGFGLEVAKWMVDEGARNLVLTGRRGAKRRGAGGIRLLQEKGAQVLAAAVDVTQEDQLKTLFRTIAEPCPRYAASCTPRWSWTTG